MRNVLHRFFFLLLLGVASQLSAEPQGGKPDPYRFRDGDQVKLTVFQQPDLTKSLTIDQDGKVSVPTIAEAISLRGLTLAEAEQKIRQALPNGGAKSPPIALKMLKYAQEFVHVGGEVHLPGAVGIPLQVGIDLETALAIAGGFTAFADLNAIERVTGDGVRETLTWAEIKREKKKKLLKAGDQITVSKGPLAKTSVSVEGRVEKRGLVTIPKSGKLDLASALLLAGGPSSLADRSRIELIPADGRESSMYQYDALLRDAVLKDEAGRVPLKPGDRVRVHQSPFVGLGVTIKGAVMNEGFQPFPLDGRLDLTNAIARSGGFNSKANMKNVTLTRQGKIIKFNVKALMIEMTPIWLQPGDVIEVYRR